MRKRIAIGLGLAALIYLAPWLTSQAAALKLCGGNQDQKTAPVHCENTKTIDGTTFRVVVDAPGNGTITVTYTLDAPRQVDTPWRVTSNIGISSTNQESEQTGTIPAGQTSAVATVTNKCGQLDVKAVFVGRGDARGRIAGPYINEEDLCQETPETTTTAPPTSAPGTTTPGSTPTSPPSSGPVSSGVPGAGGGRLPETGGGPDLRTVLVALGALALGGAVVALTRRTRHA